MPEYDSPVWDWGVGYCKKHRGHDLPCKVCIETQDPDLLIITSVDHDKIPSLIVKGSIKEFFHLNKEPDLIGVIKFPESFTFHNGDTIRITCSIKDLYHPPTTFKPRIPLDIELLRDSLNGSIDINPIKDSVKRLVEKWGDKVKIQFLNEGGSEQEWNQLTQQ